MFLVTGTSRGLGFSIAHQLLERQHDVIGIERSNIPSRDFPVDICDLGSPISVRLYVESQAFKNLEDVTLICNAATASAVVEPQSSYPTHLLVNALAHFYLALVLARRGQLRSIVALGSTRVSDSELIFSKKRVFDKDGYFVSKQLGVKLLESVAEVNSINYSLICPGAMKTRLVRDVMSSAMPGANHKLINFLAYLNGQFAKSTDSVAREIFNRVTLSNQLVNNSGDSKRYDEWLRLTETVYC